MQKLFVQNAPDEFVSARRRREACRGTLTDDNEAMADSDKHNVLIISARVLTLLSVNTCQYLSTLANGTYPLGIFNCFCRKSKFRRLHIPLITYASVIRHEKVGIVRGKQPHAANIIRASMGNTCKKGNEES